MSYTQEQLRQIAVTIVAKNQPCKPYTLLDILKRQYGASHGDANRTMLELIRDGRVKRTFFGDLVLPGGGGGGVDVGQLVVYVLFMGGILAFMAWVIYQMIVVN
jgi:hypothetical protein